MKKLWDILVLLLAVHFLAMAVGAGWLYKSGRLDREKLITIRDLLFPKPAAAAAATQPAPPDPATQPTLRLEELLAKVAGQSASEQVEFIQHAFDEQMAQLDRRQRELLDLQRQVDLAKEQLARDRTALDQDRKTLETEQTLAAKLQTDKGFQDSLQLYISMPPKKVKQIFDGLDDQTVMRYLEAMQPRTAARIANEFKTPAENTRIQKVLEKMRQAQESNAPASSPSNQ